MVRSRQKTCSLCNKSALTLYRVQHDEAAEWIFVCHDCWQKVSQDNPLYVYGGTWKAQKK